MKNRTTQSPSGHSAKPGIRSSHTHSDGGDKGPKSGAPLDWCPLMQGMRSAAERARMERFDARR